MIHTNELHIARVVHEAMQAWDAAHSITEGHMRWDDLPITTQRERANEIGKLLRLGEERLLCFPDPPKRAKSIDEEQSLDASREALRNAVVAALLHTTPR